MWAYNFFVVVDTLLKMFLCILVWLPYKAVFVSAEQQVNQLCVCIYLLPFGPPSHPPIPPLERSPQNSKLSSLRNTAGRTLFSDLVAIVKLMSLSFYVFISTVDIIIASQGCYWD